MRAYFVMSMRVVNSETGQVDDLEFAPEKPCAVYLGEQDNGECFLMASNSPAFVKAYLNCSGGFISSVDGERDIELEEVSSRLMGGETAFFFALNKGDANE